MEKKIKTKCKKHIWRKLKMKIDLQEGLLFKRIDKGSCEYYVCLNCGLERGRTIKIRVDEERIQSYTLYQNAKKKTN